MRYVYQEFKPIFKLKMKIWLCAFALIISCTVFSQESSIKKLDSLTGVYEKLGYSGTILVAKGDHILYQKGYGYANFEKKIANTPQTIFKTESVGKMFTAVSVLQLIEQGKLSYEQRVSDLLPELKIKNADKITIRQLLGHTSGLQDPWNHPDWNWRKDYSKAELMKLIAEVPLAFDTPGTEYNYSSSGYIILGWILEKISGKTLEAYFKQNLFTPMHMSTHSLKDTVMPATAAQPYRLITSNRYISMNYHISANASGAGGWLSTAQDLYRFMLGLDQSRYFHPHTREIMFTANKNIQPDTTCECDGYGIEGFRNTPIKGTSLFGHNGGGAGFNVDAYFDPITHYIIINCTNIFQNSRKITFNYFRAVLNQPLEKVSQLLYVRIYDKIVSAGIENFCANYQLYFKELGFTRTPDLMTLLIINEEMIQVHDIAASAKWLDMVSSLYPANARVMELQGDTMEELGKKDIAKSWYEKAILIAEKNNNPLILERVKEKIKRFE
jgi:CubicO group peptidase (beta-lactamase class C family)